MLSLFASGSALRTCSLSPIAHGPALLSDEATQTNTRSLFLTGHSSWLSGMASPELNIVSREFRAGLSQPAGRTAEHNRLRPGNRRSPVRTRTYATP